MKNHRKTVISGISRPFVLSLALGALSLPSVAVPNSALCASGQCQPAISQTRFFERDAFKLSDGKTEAIVVPAIGRIMSYGKVGGPNLLWNSPTSAGIDWGWKNYGGDKNWLAPQAWWSVWHSKGNWPPDPAFDGLPHSAQVLSGGKLEMTSPLSPATGIRFIRTMSFASNGEFVVQQRAVKERGARVKGSIWNITQIVPGEAMFLPTRGNSVYKNNFHFLSKNPMAQPFENLKPTLLRIEPKNSGGGWKIGADADVSSIASVKDGVAFVQKSAKPAGEYPDGADNGAGFPVELYINGGGQAETYYAELELLSPLRDFGVGTGWTHTMRWSLHDLPSKDAKSSEVAEAVEKLLFEK